MSITTLYLYHHGEFTTAPNISYVGGKVEVIENFDCDTLSFRDLEEFAALYSYDNSNSLVYYKCDGHSFSNGRRLIYDDTSVRDLIELCKPYDKIELYVEHCDVDDLFDEPKSPEKTRNDTEIEKQKLVEDMEVGAGSCDTDEDLNPDYLTETDSDESDIESLVPDSDPEIERIRQNAKQFKGDMFDAMNDANKWTTDESESENETLRPLSSSSEDENAKIGYVGPPNPKKRKINKKQGRRSGIIRFEIGQKFVNMSEFKESVRKYALNDRRGIHFAVNEKKRCQVCCENGCPFYIWCSMDKDSDACTIKTMVDNHLCTKPYYNKMATVKYLSEVFGDRIRKNPQWKVKEMAETIKNELEIDVPKIKILRLRKVALEGVAESLRQHYSRLRDYDHELLLSNPQNTVKIATTRLNENDPPMFKRFYVCYHATKAGWKAGCRPFIGLDGCFLKTVTGGQVLSAVGRDGNNQMFPICYAIVESENTDSWMRFLSLLIDDLELQDGT